MASARYTLNIKPEDLKPDEQVPLTPKQKRQNFWYYNKWKIFAGLAALVVLGIFVADVVGKVEPDVQVAVLCQEPVPSHATDRLGQAMQQAGLIPDLNGDGRQVVQVNQYNLNFDEGQQVDYATQMASSVKLVTDLQEGSSTVFLIDNVELMQQHYECFLPAEGAQLTAWEDAAGLAGMDLTVENPYTKQTEDAAQYFVGFTVVRRGFTADDMQNEKKLPAIQTGDALYKALTEGQA